MSIIKKVCYVVERNYIKTIKLFSMEKYKQLYPKYLRKLGIDISTDYYRGRGYIDPTAHFDNSDYGLIHIGNNTTITMNVVLLTHDYSISIGLKSIGIDEKGRILKPITIGENCFIGAGSILLPGTHIGDNCVIGAGSVVKGNIPANSLICGNPAVVVAKTDEWARKHVERKDYIPG